MLFGWSNLIDTKHSFSLVKQKIATQLPSIAKLNLTKFIEAIASSNLSIYHITKTFIIKQRKYIELANSFTELRYLLYSVTASNCRSG